MFCNSLTDKNRKQLIDLIERLRKDPKRRAKIKTALEEIESDSDQIVEDIQRNHFEQCLAKELKDKKIMTRDYKLNKYTARDIPRGLSFDYIYIDEINFLLESNKEIIIYKPRSPGITHLMSLFSALPPVSESLYTYMGSNKVQGTEGPVFIEFDVNPLDPVLKNGSTEDDVNECHRLSQNVI